MTNPSTPKKNLNYRDAGVDIEKANTLVNNIKSLSQHTPQTGVLNGIGGFGALFELNLDNIQQPILISGTDGVGTKLLLANQLNHHEHIGIDLVAMCANDILCHGAKPLYFLDYYATGALQLDQADTILKSITRGCQQANMALIGGETAEMPGLYSENHYDLAGFCVGIADKSQLITPALMQAGDQLIGLASQGAHANGYSLIRKILSETQTPLDMAFDDTTIGQTLINPTRIYVNSVLSLLTKTELHGIAHITGGGLLENIPRILPDNLRVHLNVDAFPFPPLFQWIQNAGNMTQEAMLRTFNCGIGMVLAVPESAVDMALEHLAQSGEQAKIIGDISQRNPNEAQIRW